MFPIILVFILWESVDRSDNPTSRRNMNSRSVYFIFYTVQLVLYQCSAVLLYVSQWKIWLFQSQNFRTDAFSEEAQLKPLLLVTSELCLWFACSINSQ